MQLKNNMSEAAAAFKIWNYKERGSGRKETAQNYF